MHPTWSEPMNRESIGDRIIVLICLIGSKESATVSSASARKRILPATDELGGELEPVSEEVS